MEIFSTDTTPETCQIALDRLKWLRGEEGAKFSDPNPYKSVDPSPLVTNGNVAEWSNQLMDVSLPLFVRYRALFALRNCGNEVAVLALATGFDDSSALFKHEIAYVLGQMKHPAWRVS